jgi:hypothetical protein
MNGAEIVEFSTAVSQAFRPNDLATLLLRFNYMFYNYVVIQSTYPEQVVQLAGRANSEGWIGRLVVEVVRDRPLDRDIQTFLNNNPHWNPATNPPLDHPCDTLFVFGGKCFIGRRDLRKFLKAMNNPTGRKVLVVTSDRRKIGKTYSKELISFLSDNQQPSGVVPIDLDQDDYDPAKLAAAIARFMGVALESMPPQGQQQAARWNQELVDWLVPVVPNLATTVGWIVLDGFRQKMLSEATQDFISQLAQRVQGTTRFRLILLNYTIRLPLAVEAFVYKDEVRLLDHSEVQAFLSKVHERKHGAEPTPDLLSEYVTGVYERLAQYAQEYPDVAEDQLLLNMAVSEAAEIIQG